LIKPDGVQRRLVGEILGRIEGKGLTIAALELKDVGDDLARSHYANTRASRSSLAARVHHCTRIVEARGPLPRRQIAGGTDPV